MRFPSFIKWGRVEGDDSPLPKTGEDLAREREEEEKRKKEQRRERVLRLRERGQLDAIVQVGSAYMRHSDDGRPEPHLFWYGWENPIAYDLKEVEGTKENENVLVAGTSRAGKTTLVNWLLRKMANGKRAIVISFKTEDEYLFLGNEFPVADMTKMLPDPFADTEAFMSAFAVTYPVSNVGVTASYVPVLLREAADESKGWGQLESVLDREIRETKDTIKRSALGFIREHIKPLAAYGSNPLSLPDGRNVVLDFSGLNEDAKTFYAELVLRRLWNDMKEGRIPERATVAIDEAHRLSRARFEKYESVLHEMARQVARWGALWATTQNYTDLDDSIRGQFSYQYVFRTTAEGDLSALRKIDEVLAWTVSALPVHTFTDARHHSIHKDVPVLYYRKNTLLPEEEKEAEKQASLVPEGVAVEDHNGRKAYRIIVTGRAEEAQPPASIDYRAEVIGILGHHPSHASKMGRMIAEKYSIAKDAAKLGTKQVLQKLVNEGLVERVKFDTEPEGRASVVLFYLKGENESSLHAYMVEEVRKLLEERELPILHVAKSGEDSLPDIELGERRDPTAAVVDPVSGIGIAMSPGGFNVEVETGLKKDMTSLLKRIEESVKHTVIVTPNSDVAERYAKVVDAEPILASKTSVMTFAEFSESARKRNGESEDNAAS